MNLRSPALLVVLLAFLAACHDSPTDAPGPPVFEIRLTPDSSELLVGQSLSLVARTFEDGKETNAATVTWASSDTSIAAVDILGSVTAKKIGSATITATAQGFSKTSKIVVKQVQGCDAPQGLTHTGVADSAVWRAKDSPHFVRDSVIVLSKVTVEAGAIVCMYPNAAIRVRGPVTFTAAGTAAQRVRFLAMDTLRGWNGIATGGFGVGGGIQLDYTDVEFGHAVGGYVGASFSTFKNTSLYGAGNFNSMNILHSVIENGDVQISAGTFEDNIIRRGKLEAWYGQPGSPLTVSGGRIEDSPTTAFKVGSTFDWRVPNITIGTPPVIVHAHGLVVQMPGSLFFSTWPTAEAQAALLDNENATVSLWSGSWGALHLRSGLTWELFGPTSQSTASSLTLDAGAGLRIENQLTVNGAMTAIGTSALPIGLSSVQQCWGSSACGLTLGDTATSTLSHVVLSTTFLRTGPRNVLQADHIDSDGFITLAAPHSRITDSEIHDVPHWSYFTQGALNLAADSITASGIVIRRVKESAGAVMISGNDVAISACEITDNVADGVVVSAGSNTQVHDCNIERNGGLGVKNATANIVNARSNWWGDSAGPNGPSGDGVSANVDFAQWYGQPRARLLKPKSITLSASSLLLATPDTFRLTAILRDSAGTALSSERVIWRSSDSAVASIDANESGLVVSRAGGSTTITAMAASDTLVRVTALVTVTAAGPVYTWKREEVGSTSLSRIWGSAPNDIYVSSTSGLLHYNGTAWTPVAGGPPSPTTIVGRNAADFFVQSGNDVWHWNGSSWSRVTSPGTIERIAQIGPSDLIVLTLDGIYRNVDSAWSFLFKPIEDNTSSTSLWGRSPTDIFLGGSQDDFFWYGGAVQHWNGNAVTWMPGSPPAQGLTGTTRFVYALGVDYDQRQTSSFVRSARFDGTTWLPVDVPSKNRKIREAYAYSDENVAAGGGDAVYVLQNGKWWTPWTGYRAEFGPVWMYGSDVYVIGAQQDQSGHTYSILLHGVRASP